MTRISDDEGSTNRYRDRQLVAFLKRYRSIEPAASPDLEDRTIAALPPRVSTLRRSLWIAPLAVAASVSIAWMGYHHFSPNEPSKAELAQLETFIEETWYCSVERCEEEVWEAELWESDALEANR
ncbi:MAG: hypothetical protein J7641_01015 [Cyanobacteria bacterium SID2]|nr:hypothetical protein [Cyanobacteria bacterium SID2]MBP0002423.1 hypothetical protein [Cyanobacteria bacterium SBC]